MNTENKTRKIENTDFSYIDNSPEQEINLLDIWAILYRNKLYIIGFSFIGLLVGIIISLNIEPVYRASTTLLVSSTQPALPETQMQEGMPSVNFFYETQYEIIRSRLIAQTVVDNLQLQIRKKFLPQQQPNENKSWFNSEKNTKTNSQYKNTTDEKMLVSTELYEYTIDQVQNNTTVKNGKKSQIMTINYEHTDANLAAEVVNEIAKSYSEFGLTSRMASLKNTTRWLNSRLVELRKKLVSSETTLQSYQSRESMVDSKNRTRIIGARLSALTNELLNAQNERSEAQIHYQQISDVRKSNMSNQKLVAMLVNNFIQRLYADYIFQQRKVSELSERYGDKHPKLIAARADLEETNKTMREKIDDAIGGVEKTYEATIAKEREIKHRINAQQNQMRTVTGKGFQLVKLERDVKANRQLYDTFLTRFKEAGINSENDLPSVRVIDTALAPNTPYKPNRRIIPLISLILGLIIGISFAFFRNLFENTFKSSAEIEEKLLLPVLAETPYLKEKNNNPIKPERYILTNPHSEFTEAINHIRTGVLFSNLDKSIKSVLVTSAQSGDGKTTLAINLALSFSKMGRTLLLDADLRHPDIRRITGIKKGSGLSDWITGKKLKQCCIEDKESSNLVIMTTGELSPTPLELLSSNKFKNKFSTLKEQFDYVVIDSPPVLPVSDALVVGQLVDSVILAIKFDGTTFFHAKEALKRLRHSGIEPLGAVMNMVDLDKIKKYYGSKYGKNYSGFYGEYYGKGAEQ